MSTVLDPADAFVELYDQLTGTDESAIAAALGRSADIDEVRTTVLAQGGLPDDLGAEPLITLFGLDDSLLTVMTELNRASDTNRHGLLRQVQKRLLRSRRLDSGAHGGALLPRRAAATRQGPPDYLVDALVSCVRVPPAEWARVRFVALPGRADLPPKHRLTASQLSVATLAGAESFDQFDIGPVTRAGTLGYKLAPNPAKFDAARVAELVSSIDGSGAQVAVLPEGLLDDAVLAEWRTALRSSHKSACRWVLLGSGPVGGGVPPANRAVLVDRFSGKSLLEQDKRGRFNLRPDHIEHYEMKALLPADEMHVEDIAIGTELVVLESAVGRFCVLVCEDLARLVQDGSFLRAVGPSHVLVPIFSSEILRKEWEEKNANDLSRQIGSTVVVVNSLAVPLARETAGNLVGDEWWSSFVQIAHDPDVGYGHTEGCLTRSPTEASVFKLPPAPGDAAPDSP